MATINPIFCLARALLTAYLLDRFAVAVSPYTMRRRIASGRDGISV